MSDIVWVSRAMEHASNQRPLRNDVGEQDHARLVEIQKRIERGDRLEPSDFPNAIFGELYAKEKDYLLPNLFFGYGYWVVSKAAADVLGQFDLGQGSLFPVQVLRDDRRTPVGGEWLCINFGNQKTALIPGKSAKIHMGAQGRYAGVVMVTDGDLAVSSAALEGPDIWIDTQLWDAFFMSEALGKALRKAKVDQGFLLRACRVIDA
jgi:hypothetical protein